MAVTCWLDCPACAADRAAMHEALTKLDDERQKAVWAEADEDEREGRWPELFEPSWAF